MGRFLHTAVSFQFHENSTGILLFHAKLANTAAVYKRFSILARWKPALKSRWIFESIRGAVVRRADRVFNGASFYAKRAEIEGNWRYLCTKGHQFGIERGWGGKLFFVINHWNVQWKFLLGVAFSSLVWAPLVALVSPKNTLLVMNRE